MQNYQLTLAGIPNSSVAQALIASKLAIDSRDDNAVVMLDLGIKKVGPIAIDGVNEVVRLDGESSMTLQFHTGDLSTLIDAGGLQSVSIVRFNVDKVMHMTSRLSSSPLMNEEITFEAKCVLSEKLIPSGEMGNMKILFDAPVMTKVRETLMSDWSDFSVHDLSDETIESLSYLEVTE